MIRSLMESSIWLAAGWTMLHFLWVGCGIGLVAAAERLALRRAGPNVRYAFALTCLAAMAAAPAVIGARVFDAPQPAALVTATPSSGTASPALVVRTPRGPCA